MNVQAVARGINLTKDIPELLGDEKREENSLLEKKKKKKMQGLFQ